MNDEYNKLTYAERIMAGMADKFHAPIPDNDEGKYAILFFDSADDDAYSIAEVGPFYSLQDAFRYSVEAMHYAKENGIPWFPTETIAID